MHVGDVATYEGVLIELPTYRQETKKLKFGQTLIDSMNREFVGLANERIAAMQLSRDQAAIIKTQYEYITNKDKAFSELNANYNALHTQATKPRNWLDDPWKVGIAAFVFGVILAKR